MAPLIDKEQPTSLQLQEWLGYAHQIRFNDLTRLPEMDGNAITNLDLTYQLLAQQHGIEAGKAQAADALMFVAQSNPYNPVAEYLEGLRDNQDIELMSREDVARLFGVAAGDAVSADLLQRSLAGTAKRGLEPGCKFDQCPILRSEEQGLGKTEALRSLAGPGWYDNLGKADKNLALSGWKVTSKMAGCWVLELGEIDQLTRGHCSSELKDWITTKVDTYAEKKEKLATPHPRRCVPWGTTNESELLNDDTGTRRYWIIEVARRIDWQQILVDRDRIWKSAVSWLDGGTETWLNPETEEGAALTAAAAERGQSSTFKDPWITTFVEYLGAVIEEHQHLTPSERQKLADSGFPKRVSVAAGEIHSIRLRYMKRGHHSSGQLNVFVSLDDLHEAMEIKAKDRTKGSSARISKAMRDPQITNQGWQPCKNKKLGRGFVLSTDGGSDSGSDSPLVPILDWEPRTTPAQGIWGWFRSLEGKKN